MHRIMYSKRSRRLPTRADTGEHGWIAINNPQRRDRLEGV